ncbi:hypothetical protein N7524_001221 [Penicillium chrysogenum]|nr:hypothetical protein N7524_001221 [Penicillium chrysogenum]
MYLNAGLSQDAVLPYIGAEDMFKDLKAMFDDNRTEYLESMKPTDDFYVHLCKFLHNCARLCTAPVPRENITIP